MPNLDRYRREVVGLVFQLHNLLPHLDARRNIEIAMFGTHRSRRQRRVRAEELLAEVHLADKANRKPPELSGGERQRVALRAPWRTSPRSCLPTNRPEASIPASVEQTLELFQNLRAEHGITIVMVTHDHDVASAADRVVNMVAGRIDEPVLL